MIKKKVKSYQTENIKKIYRWKPGLMKNFSNKSTSMSFLTKLNYMEYLFI